MKKILLHTCALVAAATISAPAAMANDASLMVHGTLDSKIALVDDDTPTRDDMATISTQSEIGFHGTMTADNGIDFGLDIALENDGNSVVFSRQIAFANTGFGRFELGDGEGAVQRLGIGLPDVGDRTLLDGRYAEFSGMKTIGQGLHTGTGEAYDSMDTAARLTYFSPRTSGFQFGASFTPDWDDRGSSNLQSDSGYETALEAAATFTNTVSSVDYSVGATVTSLEASSNLKAAGSDDVLAFSAGLSVGYMGFSGAVGYTHLGDYARMNGSDTSEANFGIGYNAGPYTLAANYALTQVDDASDTDWNTFAVGAGYRLAPGINFTAEVVHYEYSSSIDSDGTVGMLGTTVRF